MALAFIHKVERVVGVPARMYFNIELQIHIFFSLSIPWTIIFISEGSANTQNKNTKNFEKYKELFKVETCGDCEVADGGKEHCQWQHFLF